MILMYLEALSGLELDVASSTVKLRLIFRLAVTSIYNRGDDSLLARDDSTIPVSKTEIKLYINTI